MSNNIKKTIKNLFITLLFFTIPITAFAKTKWPAPVFDNRAWKLDWSENRNGNRFEEYTLKQETVQNWSELITMQFFRGQYNALKFAQQMEETIKRSCPNTDFKIVSNKNDLNVIIWTFEVTNCPGQKSQVEVARAVVVPGSGIHIFHYATTNLKISQKNYNMWLINLFKINVKTK